MVAYSDIVLEPKGTSSAVATKTEEVVDTSLGTLLTNVSSIGSRVLKAAGEGAATDSYLSANKALEAESKEFAMILSGKLKLKRN